MLCHHFVNKSFGGLDENGVLRLAINRLAANFEQDRLTGAPNLGDRRFEMRLTSTASAFNGEI
jgi:hypothetical protein